MRPYPLPRWFALSALLALSGCEVAPPPTRTSQPASPSAAAPDSDGAVDPAAAAVETYTRQLAAARQQQSIDLPPRQPLIPQPIDLPPPRQSPPPALPADASPLPPAANEVMWLTPGVTAQSLTPAASNPSPPPSAAPPQSPAVANTMTPMEVSSAAPVEVVEVSLLDRVAIEGESDLDKALRAVGLSLTQAQGELPPRYLAALEPEQQHAVQLYHDLMLTMRQQMLADGGRLDRDALAGRLDELFGQQPITIRDLRLCRRVNGYGVYEPLDSTTLLAGQEQPAIVYVELDDFASLDRGDGQHLVRLQQDVTLYAADGLAVWRNEPVQVNDLSANRRRDFFVVQLIKLPSRLSVGKYRLKVRVSDLQGGSIDERGLDLDFVADRAMVRTPQQESAPLR